MNRGSVKLASSRSHDGIVDHESFECKMYIIEQEEAEFVTTNPTTATIKLAKYGKQ